MCSGKNCWKQNVHSSHTSTVYLFIFYITSTYTNCPANMLPSFRPSILSMHARSTQCKATQFGGRIHHREGIFLGINHPRHMATDPQRAQFSHNTSVISHTVTKDEISCVKFTFVTCNKLCARPPQYAPCPLQVDLWPFDLESGVRVTCNVGYLCPNCSLPRPLCSRLRPDVRDREDVRRASSLNAPTMGAGCPHYGGRGIIIIIIISNIRMA